MKDYHSEFAGKKVTVMRIGLLGRGVGDAAWLAEMGVEVLVVDDAPQEVMQPSVDALSQYESITFKFGPYANADFESADYVLVGAGTPLDLPCLAAARAADVPLKQSAAWFAELADVPVIGVTGTRGKSTVTNMIHHSLRMITGEEILLGGNIRGVSNLQLLKKLKEDSLCVMELDSWQLQGWGWNHMSPQIAIFTNFMEDHQNYYRTGEMTTEEGMAAYFKDKAQIFLHQDEGGVFVTTPEVFAMAKSVPNATLGQEVVLADASVIPEDALLTMPGEHNRLNAALAVETLKALSLTEEEIFPALASFPGVEGRLQYVGEYEGVRIYNDNNATTPAATAAGLRAVDESAAKNVILIAGGADKGLDTDSLVAAIETHTKSVVLLSGTGTDLLNDQIEATVCDSIEAAVTAAMAAAVSGDVLLFSPGYASFGMFKNEYERNDEFMRVISQYGSE